MLQFNVQTYMKIGVCKKSKNFYVSIQNSQQKQFISCDFKNLNYLI